MRASDDGVALLARLHEVLAVPDAEALTAGMCAMACELTGAQVALFAEVGGDRPVVAGPAASGLGDVPDPAAASLLAAGMAAAEPMLVDDVARFASDDAALRPYGSLADGRVLRSWITAPVAVREGTTLGALMVGHADVRAFGPADQQAMGVLADHLGAAVWRVRMVEDRARVAQALQQTLLPPLLPRIAGVELAARYRASSAGETIGSGGVRSDVVGGDFYDVFECGRHAWGVLLGDVSGVGPEAAALTGIARYTARAVSGASCAPSEVLAAINLALANQRTEDRFCTAVFALLRPGGGGTIDITIASGGHPPALVLRDDGTVERLELEPGVLLGPFPEADFEEDTIHLHPGDALVLYTDGVTEARNSARDLFGQRRLQEVVAACAGRTADGIARRVELAATDFGAGRATDDVAVVVVRAAP